MRRLSWTRPALEDLRAIECWLELHASGQIASRILRAVRDRADFLIDFPHGGRPNRAGTRVLLVIGTPYLIIYRIIDNDIQILRVRHERENWLVQP